MKKSLIAIFAALLLLSPKASAQSVSDLGTWTSIQLVKSFGAPYAMARLEHRSFDHIQSTECWFAMAGGGYMMYEIFGSMDGKGWVRSLHYAGSEISLGGGHSLDFFYMYHLYGTAGLTGACHLLGAGYTFVF